jgi:acyl-CoA synthetase (AMP-forming)/AMP-acid ligase II
MNPFDYSKTFTDFWTAQGQALMQERAGTALAEGIQAVTSGKLPMLPDMPADLSTGAADLTYAAFLELKPGTVDVTEVEIIQFCRQSMARFRVPKRVVFGELPKTTAGEIQKFKLRERVAGLAAAASS